MHYARFVPSVHYPLPTAHYSRARGATICNRAPCAAAWIEPARLGRAGIGGQAGAVGAVAARGERGGEGALVVHWLRQFDAVLADDEGRGVGAQLRVVALDERGGIEERSESPRRGGEIGDGDGEAEDARHIVRVLHRLAARHAQAARRDILDDEG